MFLWSHSSLKAAWKVQAAGGLGAQELDLTSKVGMILTPGSSVEVR